MGGGATVSLAARLITLGKGGGAELKEPNSALPFHTCRLLVAGPERKYLDNARNGIQDVLRSHILGHQASLGPELRLTGTNRQAGG